MTITEEVVTKSQKFFISTAMNQSSLSFRIALFRRFTTLRFAKIIR
jgi:hypothetical protein